MMKKSLPILILVLFIISCKKNQDTAATPPGLQSQMVGKWSIVTFTENTYDINGNIIPSQQHINPGMPGDYFQFNNDGTSIEYFYLNRTNGFFAINSPTNFTISVTGFNYSCNIASITANSLVFVEQGPQYPGQGHTDFTFSLTR